MGTGAPPNAMKVRQAGKGACHRTTAMKRETIIVIRVIIAIVSISLIRIVIAARADEARRHRKGNPPYGIHVTVKEIAIFSRPVLNQMYSLV